MNPLQFLIVVSLFVVPNTDTNSDEAFLKLALHSTRDYYSEVGNETVVVLEYL